MLTKLFNKLESLNIVLLGEELKILGFKFLCSCWGRTIMYSNFHKSNLPTSN